MCWISTWRITENYTALWYWGKLVMPPTSKKLTGHIGFGLCDCPLKNHACQGFEISYMDSSWKNIWHTFFSCPELSPFLELCPFEKIWTKSHACHILWTVHARVLKFHIWIPHGKIADLYFFLVWVICLWKNQHEIFSARNSKNIWARGLELGQLIGNDE